MGLCAGRRKTTHRVPGLGSWDSTLTGALHLGSSCPDLPKTKATLLRPSALCRLGERGRQQLSARAAPAHLAREVPFRSFCFRRKAGSPGARDPLLPSSSPGHSWSPAAPLNSATRAELLFKDRGHSRSSQRERWGGRHSCFRVPKSFCEVYLLSCSSLLSLFLLTCYALSLAMRVGDYSMHP